MVTEKYLFEKKWRQMSQKNISFVVKFLKKAYTFCGKMSQKYDNIPFVVFVRIFLFTKCSIICGLGSRPLLKQL